jgi:hypothetical protein
MRRFIVLLFVILSGGPTSSQSTDYKRIFGDDWKKAETFVSENEYWMKPALENKDIPFTFAVSIVFPELIRYSALQDKIEISLLKTLYINLGEEYADFSIGPFQMKPSFAEDIHKKVMSLKDKKIRNLFSDRTTIQDIKDYRTSIVADLEDPETEVIYLIAFIKICESGLRNVWTSANEKIKFYASAYNCGLDKGQDYIYAMSEKKYFSTSLVKTKTYSYSDISVYWYNLNSKSGKD